jgi:hypothetical protein
MDDRNAAATKGDVQDLETRLDERIKSVETRLDERIKSVETRLDERIDILQSEMQHRFDDVIEKMRDGQTEILKAFYTFAESNQMRLSATEQDSGLLKTRLALLEKRITDVEMRLNFPPAA